MDNASVAKREKTQSIAVSLEEQEIIAVLAMAYGLKAATIARHLLYRGLEDYLRDGSVRAEQLDSEIRSAMDRHIEANARLRRARELHRAQDDIELVTKGQG